MFDPDVEDILRQRAGRSSPDAGPTSSLWHMHNSDRDTGGEEVPDAIMIHPAASGQRMVARPLNSRRHGWAADYHPTAAQTLIDRGLDRIIGRAGEASAETEEPFVVVEPGLLHGQAILPHIHRSQAVHPI